MATIRQTDAGRVAHPARRSQRAAKAQNGAGDLGFEATLWKAADAQIGWSGLTTPQNVDLVAVFFINDRNGWVAGEMIPPVPFYKHCPEVLIHNTARAMDAILALEE